MVKLSRVPFEGDEDVLKLIAVMVCKFCELYQKSLNCMIHELHLCCVFVAKSCPTLFDPRDCSPWGSSVLELARILQSRILEQVAIPFSRGSARLRDWTWVSSITGRFFNIWAIKQVPELYLKLFLQKKDHILIAIISGWWDLEWSIGLVKKFLWFSSKK